MLEYIKGICALSDTVSEYFQEEKYKDDGLLLPEHEHRLNVKAFDMLLDELEQWGIVSNLSTDDMFSAPIHNQCVLTLYETFKHDDLYTLLSKLGETQLETLVNILESSIDWFEELVDFMANNSYLSAWKKIQMHLDNWTGSEGFREYLTAILDEIEYADDAPTVADNNVTMTLTMTIISAVQRDVSKLNDYIEEIKNSYPTLDAEGLKNDIVRHLESKADLGEDLISKNI